MKRIILMLMIVTGIVSCHNNRPGSQPVVKKDTTMMKDSMMTMAPASKPDLKGLTFAYQKDPSCGMPLKAGLEDTLRYKGKLYGFCSKECKDEFLKNPASYLAQAK